MTPKDEVLAALAERVNVAQFVSFGPDELLPVRYVRLRDRPPDRVATAADAVATLLGVAGTVNIRTFVASASGARRGTPFLYGLASVDEVLARLRRHARDGYHTIVNETVAVDDGGVSGVALGGLVEFAPDDTPRCVDRPGTAALPRHDALRLFEAVYGFRAELPDDPSLRVEFSLHPGRVGLRAGHTLVWEQERVVGAGLDRPLVWPNRFSRLLGDKAFGLLVAELCGVPVPATTVVGRRVAPFSFGTPTGTAEHWLRTAPAEPAPGRFPTTFGWRDPYRLLAEVDPTAEVASVLAQEAVPVGHSGALLASADDVHAEGVAGRGDEFMLGRQAPQDLPAAVIKDVRWLAETLVGRLGPVRIEWVHDGERAWVVQLQQVAAPGDPAVIVAGEAATWRTFHAGDGLDSLRAVLADLGTDEGVVLRGAVGVTSHFGDLLRRAGVPSRLEPPASPPPA